MYDVTFKGVVGDFFREALQIYDFRKLSLRILNKKIRPNCECNDSTSSKTLGGQVVKVWGGGILRFASRYFPFNV